MNSSIIVEKGKSKSNNIDYDTDHLAFDQKLKSKSKNKYSPLNATLKMTIGHLHYSYSIIPVLLGVFISYGL